jgi:hypothetical protein
MAHNMDFKKGIYPGDPGYKEWTGFEREKGIPGRTTKSFDVIHPNKFHKKLLENGSLRINRTGGDYTYTDCKIRNDIEMTKFKKYFQPKKWNIEKLLYNYDCIFHIWNNAQNTDNNLIKLYKKHITDLYRWYEVNSKHRVF